jgi:capsular polysaccharide transport system permease protein
MRELKTRFGGHWAGVVWLLGLPAAEMMVYVGVNVFMRGHLMRGQFGWLEFILCAWVPYQLFRSLWNQLAHAVDANMGLFGFKQVKPMDAFIARAMLEICLQLTVFVVIAIILTRVGFGPFIPVDPLGYLFIIGLLCAIGISLGIISAVVAQVVPRFLSLIHLTAMPLIVASGVVFSLNLMPQSLQYWAKFNPILHLVELARHAFLHGYVPLQGVSLWYPLSFALVLMTVAVCLYSVRRRHLTMG